MQLLCALLGTAIGAPSIYYLSLPPSERSAMGSRASHLAQGLYGRSVDALNYFEVREVQRLIRDQFN
jgi:hypothetical protein